MRRTSRVTVLRVAIIVVAYVAGIAGAATYLVRTQWTSAIAEARGQMFHYRTQMAPELGPDPEPADVVWLGDSTVMSFTPYVGYPRLVDARVLQPLGRRMKLFATVGLDAIGYYGLIGPALARHPRLVVLTANLRLFAPASGRATFYDLLAWLPAEEIPRLARLPYNVRGATMPSLVLMRWLRRPAVLDVVTFVEGLRHAAAVSARWDVLGPSTSPEGMIRLFARLKERSEAEYMRPLSASQPLVRFFGAAVELATRHGAQVLVVVAPIPTGTLVERGLFDGVAVARSVHALRRVVEANGGALVDASTALADEYFYDAEGGHLTTAGAELMVQIVRGPIVERLNGLVASGSVGDAPP